MREQDRIAELLDEVGVARQLQDEITDRLDELPAALFIEIFGEPGANPKNFEKAFLSELLSHVEAGPPLGKEETLLRQFSRRPARVEEYGIITPRAVTSGFFLPDENYHISDETVISYGSSLRRDDLLFSQINRHDRFGNIALLENDFPYRLLSPKVWRLRPHSWVVPSFIKGLFSTGYVRRQIHDKASSLGQVNYRIDRNALLSIQVFRPPAPLQRQFDLGYWAIVAARNSAAGAAAKLDGLYASLLFRIFGRQQAWSGAETAAPSEESNLKVAFDPSRRAFAVPERLIWHKLSRTQQFIWEITQSIDSPFRVEDVRAAVGTGEAVTNREQVINTLELLVSLGVIVKEGHRDADRWSQPDPEKDLQVVI